MRNVEIKASVNDADAIKKLAKQLSKSEGTVIEQHDTFFKAPKGRLKLRELKDGSGILIYYERPDVKGPKLSSYTKTSLNAEAVRGVKEVLSAANGILGTVEKTRYLYMIGQTRVHIDKVKDLDDFMELEVVLNDSQSIADGQKISEDLMKKLQIKNEDLVSGAYLDLLMAKN